MASNGIMWNYYIEGFYGKMPQKGTKNHIMMYRKRNEQIVSEPEYEGIYFYDENGNWRHEDGMIAFVPFKDERFTWTYHLFAWKEVEEPDEDDIRRVKEKFREEFGSPGFGDARGRKIWK